MEPWKKPYHQKLFSLFVAGEGPTEASNKAGCSVPTARKFRQEYQKAIREEQLKNADGVLQQLKDLLPDATARLRMWLHPPPPPPRPACSCGIGPAAPAAQHAPICASLLTPADPFKNHAADIRTIRTIFDAYEVMRDVDIEKRLKALERAQAEAAIEAAKEKQQDK